MVRTQSAFFHLAIALLIAGIFLALGKPVLPSSAAGDTTPPQLLVLAPPGWNPQSSYPLYCLPAAFRAIAIDNNPGVAVNAHIHTTTADADSDITLVSQPLSGSQRQALLQIPTVQAAVGMGYWSMVELLIDSRSYARSWAMGINTAVPVSFSFYAQDTAGNRAAVEFASVNLSHVGECPTFRDTDLSQSMWLYPDYLYATGIVRGDASGYLNWNSSLARLDAAIFLARAASPGYSVPSGQTPKDPSCTFSDGYAVGTEAYNAITWACNTRTMLGEGQGYNPIAGTTNKFVPTGTVTRADAAIYFSRIPTPVITSGIAPMRAVTFTDTPSYDPTLYNALGITYGLGTLDGYNLNQYQPGNSLTRLQMTVLMYRAMEQPFYDDGS